MLVIFMIDIFYFHKLDHFYTCIIFGAYYLCWRYVIFSAGNILEYYYFVYIFRQDEAIEKDYVVKLERMESAVKHYTYRDYFEDNNYAYSLEIDAYDWNPEYHDVEGLTNIRYFVDIQSNAIYLDHTLYSYTCMERSTARKKYYNKHNMKVEYLLITLSVPPYDDISKALAKDFHKLMENAINIKVFLLTHEGFQKSVTPEYTFLDNSRYENLMRFILGYLTFFS